MNPLLKTLAAVAASVGFYGCDGVHLEALKPGMSTAQEVRERLGEPAAQWPGTDGTVVWEYPRGPEGFKCWMLTLSDRGVLISIDQALTEENFARIQKGWSPEQVRRLLGKPATTVKYPLKPEIVWDWRIEPRSSGNRAFFHVHFTAEGDAPGIVTGTSRREETPTG